MWSNDLNEWLQAIAVISNSCHLSKCEQVCSIVYPLSWRSKLQHDQDLFLFL